ncbi:hypothetical protein PCASD_01454 [Puccinia coronata f. sp. avenae]|uniref:Uncharacterized protein n=1 Tax=Puccinia coronata f. sp. avenae TaxID=200324 RepID=A0A2N5VKJ5_9BASI|nr:hypothetical protein PCASD_21797 [Puccinia coronata f. sp. avenae]PLW50509.1 hypothetical protein PCASD_01454 [Puccinia coronata f. sp. avenae]
MHCHTKLHQVASYFEMRGRFELVDPLASSAAPCSTVRLLFDPSSGYPGKWKVVPLTGLTPIKPAGFVVLSFLIRFLQQLTSSHQRNHPFRKLSSPFFPATMPCTTSTSRCASANPCLASPYPLRSCRLRTLANPPVLEQPLFAGSHGQPIVINNPAPVAPPTKLPAFVNIPAPPGLGSPLFCPQTPRPGPNSPVYRPETLRPPNLDSPTFLSNKENPFVDQLALPVYQPDSPACAFPNGDGQFAGNPGPFLVHQAMIGNGWAPAPEFHHPAPPHPDSPDAGAPFGLDLAPEYNLPPIPAPYPAVKTYPFTDFSPVPTPEPCGFFYPAVFHWLNDQHARLKTSSSANTNLGALIDTPLGRITSRAFTKSSPATTSNSATRSRLLLQPSAPCASSSFASWPDNTTCLIAWSSR